MGIINATPDSFFSGSRSQGVDDILDKVGRMVASGATFVDIGGYSSRPGAFDISIEEEKKRILEPVSEMAAAFPELLISVDTFRSEVASAAIDHGAHVINDISAGKLDPKMYDVVGSLKVPYIIMHMRGTPENMTTQTYYEDLVPDIANYFGGIIEELEKFKVKDIIIDPGFGFAKKTPQNFKILDSLSYFRFLERPLLVGVSRKSMIYKTLEITPENALNGTTVLNTVALLKGASILRVHDVREAVEAVKLVNQMPL